MVIALLMALTVNLLTGRGYAMDTLLGVLAHSALAFGWWQCRSCRVSGST